MTKLNRHLVVDGSNIATEGRSLPSLAQLQDAVKAFVAERKPKQVTVIVDATFGHRIEKKERTAFDKAIAAGEILTPPAGAIGRGDAFILQVAERAEAVVLSNDSFQEFHGEHTWLFDEDRLIGGKPVEGVGWIFVARVPVRGPLSRRSTRAGKAITQTSTRGGASRTSTRSSGRKASSAKSTAANADDSAPKKDGRRKRGQEAEAGQATKRSPRRSARSSAASNDQPQGSASKPAELNSPEDFMRFVTTFSIGDIFEGIVERYSSHGCYLRASSAQCYLPSKAMGDPAPTRARDVVSLGQAVQVRVESLDSARRGINVSLIDASADQGSSSRRAPRGRRGSTTKKSSSRRRQRSKVGLTSQKPISVADGSARDANLPRSTTIVATKKSPAKKATAKKTAAKKAPAKKVAKKPAAKKAVKKAPAKRAAAKAPAKKAAKKTTAKRTAKKAPAKKAAAKKPAAKKAVKKAPAKKTAKKTTAKKAPAKKAPVKKTAAKATTSARASRAATRKKPAAARAAKKR